MQDPKSYCEEKAAAPGSDFAITRLFAPAERRDELTALHALYNELMNVAYSVSDPAVARAKLGWWREEVERAFAGGATHPVMQALAAPIESGRASRDEMEALLAGALRNVDPDVFQEEAELEDFCRATGGVRGRAEARLAGARGAGFEAAEALGAASARVMVLHLMPRDLERGRLFVPMGALARHQVSRARLESRERGRALGSLIRGRCESALVALTEARQRVRAEDAEGLRHLLVQGALDRARLKRLHRAGAGALQNPPRLSHASRLFIAWRAAGRAQRSYLKARQ